MELNKYKRCKTLDSRNSLRKKIRVHSIVDFQNFDEKH